MTQARSQVPDGGITAGYNNSGSTIAAKLGVRRNGAGADQIALAGAIGNPCIGVTMHDIPTDTRGDVQTKGLAICTSAAAITAGAALEFAASGKVQTRTTGAQCGVANTTVAAGDLDVEVWLSLPSAADGT